MVFGIDFTCVYNLWVIHCYGNKIISSDNPSYLFHRNNTNIRKVYTSSVNACVVYSKTNDNGYDVSYDIKCWGNPESGINNVPVSSWEDDLYNFDMGIDTACYFTNSTRQCWGVCTGGICDIPLNIYSIKNEIKLKVGHDNACIIYLDKINKSSIYPMENLIYGNLSCWGSNSYKQSKIPDAFKYNVLSISLGFSTTCVRKMNGLMRCWGKQSLSFEEIKNNLKTISTGGRHTCAAKSGYYECWGSNEYGQNELDVKVGNGEDNQYGDNYNVYEIGNSISAGWDFTCYWSAYKRIKCVGFNYYGQIDVTIPSDPTNYKYTNLGMKTIESGLTHSCAIYDVDQKGLLNCWGGQDEFGQVSIHSLDLSQLNIAFVAVGHDFTCLAIPIDKLNLKYKTRHCESVQCFGINEYGQTEGISEAIIVSEMSAGAAHACIIYEIGNNVNTIFNNIMNGVQCWGSDVAGQLQVPEGIEIGRSLRAGDAHNCIINVYTSEVQCWGSMEFVIGGKDVVFMDTTYEYICLVDKFNKGMCIGENEWGECDIPKYGDYGVGIYYL